MDIAAITALAPVIPVLTIERPADAVPLLREAVALAPALAEAHFQLAIALKQGEAGRSSRTAAAVRGSQSDEVDAELRRAVELEPSHAPAYVELGLRRASRREITSGTRSPSRPASSLHNVHWRISRRNARTGRPRWALWKRCSRGSLRMCRRPSR